MEILSDKKSMICSKNSKICYVQKRTWKVYIFKAGLHAIHAVYNFSYTTFVNMFLTCMHSKTDLNYTLLLKTKQKAHVEIICSLSTGKRQKKDCFFLIHFDY